MGEYWSLACLDCRKRLGGLGKIREIQGNVIDMLRMTDFMEEHHGHKLMFYGDEGCAPANELPPLETVDSVKWGTADMREYAIINPARALYVILTLGDKFDRHVVNIYYRPSVIKEALENIKKMERERRKKQSG
jgi:hypothetical protein